MVAIFHRICPANPEALTLFFAVLRNYISRTVKATTIDVEVSLPPPGFFPNTFLIHLFSLPAPIHHLEHREDRQDLQGGRHRSLQVV